MTSPDLDALAHGAVASGDTEALDRGLDAMTDDYANLLATPGNLHVELASLVDCYNQLAAIHEELNGVLTTAQDAGYQFGEARAGGHLPGAQAAWEALAVAAGFGQGPESLYRNMQAVDSSIVEHMASLHGTAVKYAGQEAASVRGFGKISDSQGTLSGQRTGERRPAERKGGGAGRR